MVMLKLFLISEFSLFRYDPGPTTGCVLPAW